MVPHLLLLAAAADAGRLEWHDQAQVGVALFPEGVQVAYDGEARLPLWGSDHLLLRDAHLSAIAHVELNPAFVRGGPVLHVAPVAFWDATVRLWGTSYFGTFSAIIPVDDPAFDGSRSGRRERVEAGARSGGVGWRADVRTRLKGRAGPVIAMAELEIRRHDVRTWEGGFDWFWEPSEMLTIPAEGGVVVDRRLYVLYEGIAPAAEGDRKLWAGLLGVMQTCAPTGDRSLRLGPLVLWKPNDAPATPTIFAGSLGWFESRFAASLPPYTFAALQWSR